MGISYKSSFSARQRITEINERNKKRLGQAMSNAKKDLLEQVAKGEGPDGALLALEPEYLAHKLGKTEGVIKRGKRKGTFVTGRGIPDMRLSGQMLQALQVTVLDFGEKLIGRLYFLAVQRGKVIGNVTGRRGKSGRVKNPRPFVGLNDSNYQKLKTILKIK